MKFEALPGLAVKLRVNGIDLQEYADENFEPDAIENEDKMVRFVEAVAGAHFSVETRIQNHFPYKFDDLRLGVLLDGKLLTGFIYRAQPDVRYIKKSVRGLERNTPTGWQFEKLTFADLHTNDGHAKPELAKELKNIGEVTVELTRVREVGPDKASGKGFAPTVSDAGVPEKALKGRAISQRATLSNPTPCAPATIVKIEYPYGTKPVATFTFKYRSHRDLQIEGMIPRSPSPVPLEERDRTTLNEDELRQLLRLQDEQLRERAKVKKEKRERADDGGDEDDGDDGEVTVVGDRRKRARTSTDSGIEVIDLSNEDDEDDY